PPPPLGGAGLPGSRLRGEPLPGRTTALPPPLPRSARALPRRAGRLGLRAAERPSPGTRHPALLLRREPGAGARGAGDLAGGAEGDLGDGAVGNRASAI